ncbi:MAG: LON peptidase substrate-binding domain-containing protein, partial [Gammaproteobacteria bacterium]|nr:LON peptidase substrate-binding domain-containing protein [Gammaproteobacteria bacterium]
MADQQLLDAEHSPDANRSSPPVSEDDRTQLPIIPVRNAVVFPGNIVQLLVDESARVELLQTVLPRQREVLIVPLADKTGVADRQQSVVTRARVLQIRPQGQGLVVLVEGLARARLVEIFGAAPTEQAISTAVVESTPPDTDDYWQAAVRNLREAAVALIRGTRSIPNEAESLIAGLNSASALTDFLAGNLELEFEKKLTLLAEPDVLARLDVLQKAASDQLRMMELQAKLRQDVDTEFSDAQRRAYLREQLRAIQKELGEDNGSDEKLAELRQRLDNAQLPAEANTQIERELTRLERLPPASPDYAGTVDYLEPVASLPWSTLTEDQLDLDRAEAILERDHHGLVDVKRRLIEYLAVRKLNPSGRGPILCLVGPP